MEEPEMVMEILAARGHPAGNNFDCAMLGDQQPSINPGKKSFAIGCKLCTKNCRIS